jgi:hypothetical protein
VIRAGERLADAIRPGRDRRRDTGGVRHVKLSEQRDYKLTVAFADTQIHTSHRAPSCFSSKAGPDPAANSPALASDTTPVSDPYPV